MRSKPVPQVITDLLQSQAAVRPRHAAFYERNSTGRWESTSWEESATDVWQIAAALRDLGLETGGRIGIVARTCFRWQITEMAGLLAGGVIVGIEPHAAQDHIEHILRDSAVTCLVVENQAILDKIPALLLGRMKLVVILSDLLASTASTPVVSWAELVTTRATAISHEMPSISADDPATVIYTSGATGTPKAIEFSHRQLLVACRDIMHAFPQFCQGDTMICWLPMAHLFQRMMNLVTIARGGAIFFVEDPREVVKYAGEVDPAVFVGVPRFYEKLFQGIQEQVRSLRGWQRRLANAALAVAAEKGNCQRRGQKLSRVSRCKYAILDLLVLRRIRGILGSKIKFMITGSAPIAPRLLTFFHDLGLPILEAYGLSENTVPLAANRLDEFRIGSVGKPFESNTIRFAADGEILVKGPGLFNGYLNDDKSAQHFTSDGFFRTGDVGKVDDDGYLYLLARKSEVIKTSTGRRIFPSRSEAKYLESPILDHVVVIGNGRHHLVGLVTVIRSQIEPLLEFAEINAAAPDEEFFRQRAVKELIRYEIETYGRDLAPHERINNIAILPSTLSIEGGELTPTLKLRRATIESRYAAVIDQLYHTSAGAVPCTTLTVDCAEALTP